MTARVEVDARQLVAGVRQLGSGIARDGPAAARRAAENCADAIRSGLPKRTGRLAGSVTVVADPEGGFGVSYGAGVDYARPVAARTGAISAGIAGIPDDFGRDCQTVAERQVRRL